LALLAALALLAFGAINGLSASTEKSDLEAQLALERRSVAQLTQRREVEPAELEQEIDQTRQQIGERLAPFPTSEEALAEISAYYTLAARHEADIVRLEAMVSSAALDPEAAIREETYLVEARGTVHNLLRLLAAITDAPFETFIFRDLTVNEDNPAWAEMRVTVLSTDLDWAAWSLPPPEEAP
jgi:phosphoglycolate phosphatase-like HAD superfamily hydrolase